MRSITTDYNNSSYNSATKFTDVYSANGFTVPAKTPVDVRALMDSVGAGDYVLSATSIEAADTTVDLTVLSSLTQNITAKISTTATAGIPVKAKSADPTKVTVSPAVARADASGVAHFVITAVGGAANDTVNVVFGTYNATNVTVTYTLVAA